MDEETVSQIQEDGQENGPKNAAEKTLRVNGFYSFSKNNN